jgi:hypothetical protein
LPERVRGAREAEDVGACVEVGESGSVELADEDDAGGSGPLELGARGTVAGDRETEPRLLG